MREPILHLENVSKDFGEGLVLHEINLDVYPGEFLTLLGPSGCGKTTTLRIIAGLEQPSFGRVYLGNQDMTDLPPERRPVNTVFQNYALFPHMNVFQNIAYGLRLRGVSRAEQQRRVTDALALVRLSGFEKRMPSQLSGGQKQRVAIARAVVLQPKILLLDEPLGALDLKLRQEMQRELKQLQQELGITFIYITHDQEEALNMSSRIAIMHDGEIEQLGTPEDVYEHPQTLFAADFIGQSNLLHGVVTQRNDDNMLIDCAGIELPAQVQSNAAIGDRVVLCLRPHRIHYGKRPKPGFSIKGIIHRNEYAGGMQHTQIMLGDAMLLNAVTQSAEQGVYPAGTEVYVSWNTRHAPVVPDAPKGGDEG